MINIVKTQLRLAIKILKRSTNVECLITPRYVLKIYIYRTLVPMIAKKTYKRGKTL